MLWAGLTLLMMPIAHGQTLENVVVQTAADVRMRAEAPTLRLCRHRDVIAPLNLTASMESEVHFTNVGESPISGSWSASPATVRAWTIVEGDELPTLQYQAELHTFVAGNASGVVLRPGAARSSRLEVSLPVWQPGYPLPDDGLRRGTRYRVVVELYGRAKDLVMAPLIYYVTIPTDVTECA